MELSAEHSAVIGIFHELLSHCYNGDVNHRPTGLFSDAQKATSDTFRLLQVLMGWHTHTRAHTHMRTHKSQATEASRP